MDQLLALNVTQIAVSVPDLPDETFLLQRMTGREELGRAFEYELEFLSDNHTVEHKDVLGRNLTVSLFVPDHDDRLFNGHVTDFAYTGTRRTHVGDGTVRMSARYRATVRPWLWFLTLKSDCRIFQGQTIPDIIEATFKRHGFSDFKVNLTGTYEPWEYCVQYRETDFDFVSRLMEHEGIYYYFDHEDGRHTMVLCDGNGTHGHRPPTPGYEELQYEIYDPQFERVFDWTIARQVDSQAVGLKAYNFRAPRDGLSTVAIAHPELVPDGVPSQAELEIYDYPGKYETSEAGDAYARKRIEELESRYEIAEGRTNARGVSVGGAFKLVNHPRSTENREYMVVSATYELMSNTHEPAAAPNGNAEPSPTFACRFRALDTRHHYYTPRTTPRPLIQGPQTAIVVGPSGEKVWPDKYGRVKVLFHWDRHSQKDGNSSCWIRVSQSWAGTGWGGMHIPHIGQEVIVEFLEGDPDRPVITGRVYNAAVMPPLDLPGEKFKSMLSDDYGNRLVFDATPGNPHIHLYSPSHKSSLVLGRSVVAKSESESVEAFGGAKTEVALGAMTETMVGSKSEGVLGFHAQLKAAISMETALGPSVIWRWGPNYEIGDSDQIHAAEQDWMQLVTGDAILDCKGEDNSKLLLCAGEKREAVVQMDENGLNLFAGEAPDRDDKTDTDPLERRLKQYMAAAVAIHAVNSTVAAVEIFKKPGTAGVEKTNDYLSATCHTLLAVLHLAAWKKAKELYGVQQKPDKIKAEIEAQKPNGKIEMLKTGQINIEAKKQNLTLGADELVSMISEKDSIVLQAEKGDIRLSTQDGVLINKGGVKHKYFEIKK